MSDITPPHSSRRLLLQILDRRGDRQGLANPVLSDNSREKLREFVSRIDDCEVSDISECLTAMARGDGFRFPDYMSGYVKALLALGEAMDRLTHLSQTVTEELSLAKFWEFNFFVDKTDPEAIAEDQFRWGDLASNEPGLLSWYFDKVVTSSTPNLWRQLYEIAIKDPQPRPITLNRDQAFVLGRAFVTYSDRLIRGAPVYHKAVNKYHPKGAKSDPWLPDSVNEGLSRLESANDKKVTLIKRVQELAYMEAEIEHDILGYVVYEEALDMIKEPFRRTKKNGKGSCWELSEVLNTVELSDSYVLYDTDTDF